jgi:hypothetical protein
VRLKTISTVETCFSPSEEPSVADRHGRASVRDREHAFSIARFARGFLNPFRLEWGGSRRDGATCDDRDYPSATRTSSLALCTMLFNCV